MENSTTQTSVAEGLESYLGLWYYLLKQGQATSLFDK